MAELKRKETGNGNILDSFIGLTELTKENCKIGLEFSMYLWEANLNLLNTQMERWFVWQESYNRFMKDLAERFPNKTVNFWNGNSKPSNGKTERFLALQKDYLKSVRGSSDKFTKDLLDLNRKNIEIAISAFDDYLNIFSK